MKKIGVFLTVSTVLAAIYILIVLFNPYDYVGIRDYQMEPKMILTDLVVVKKDISIDSLKPNDIIAFKTMYRDKEVVLVRYIDHIENNVIYTKDYEQDLDEWTLSIDDVVGTYVTQHKHFGGLAIFTNAWYGIVIIFLDIIIIALIFQILLFKISKVNIMRSRKKVIDDRRVLLEN